MGPRRARGAGSVCLRSDGRYMGTVHLGFIDGRRRVRTFYGKTAEEAEAKMRAEFPNLKTGFSEPTPRTERMREARRLGTHTNSEWVALCRAYGGTCHYCGTKRPRGGLTKDHRIPVSRGGSDAIDNIVPACKPCNSEKSTLTETEFFNLFGGRRG